jgi:predicted heme/steroid binding protein
MNFYIENKSINDVARAALLDVIAEKTNTVYTISQNPGIKKVEFHTILKSSTGFTPEEFKELSGKSHNEMILNNGYFYDVEDGKVVEKHRSDFYWEGRISSGKLVTEITSKNIDFIVLCKDFPNANQKSMEYWKFYDEFKELQLEDLIEIL